MEAAARNRQNQTSSTEPTTSSEGPVITSLTLHEIHADLLQKVQDYYLLIDECSKFEENNTDVPQDSIDSTFIMNFRKNVVDSLIIQLKENEPKVLTHQYLEVFNDMAEGLAMDLNDMNEIVSKSNHKLAAAQKEVTMLEKQIESLKIIASKRDEEGEMKEEGELDQMARDVKIVFAKYKKWLHRTVAEIFPSDEKVMETLLADLCRAFFSEEDDYVDVPENFYYKYIELLLEADIIVRHPYDKQKIRLVSFI